ncbi:unnamed protein product [Somion occarium]|uniref:Uncharacterized protein n=1 Tax=Somion occarium TaxID=3059160 RepID=A0ABP1DVF5_9APHY
MKDLTKAGLIKFKMNLMILVRLLLALLEVRELSPTAPGRVLNVVLLCLGMAISRFRTLLGMYEYDVISLLVLFLRPLYALYNIDIPNPHCYHLALLSLYPLVVCIIDVLLCDHYMRTSLLA